MIIFQISLRYIRGENIKEQNAHNCHWRVGRQNWGILFLRSLSRLRFQTSFNNHRGQEIFLTQLLQFLFSKNEILILILFCILSFLDKIGFGFTDQSALKCQRLHSITNESKSFSSVVSFVFHVHRRSVPWTSLGRHLYMLVYARWQFDGEI